jgi:sarcosine oxidase subunit alpha
LPESELSDAFDGGKGKFTAGYGMGRAVALSFHRGLSTSVQIGKAIGSDMLKRLSGARSAERERISFYYEEKEIFACPEDSVAGALMLAGFRDFRDTPVSGLARGPFCLMGSCFDCLVEIDGVANRQACMVPVEEGIRVRRQRGAAYIGQEEIAGGEDAP